MSGGRVRQIGLVVALWAAVLGPQGWGRDSKASRAYRKGDYERAAEGYRAAMSRGVPSARLEYNLGTTLFQLDEPEGARRLLESALRGQEIELRARAFYNLGNVLAQSGEGSEANLSAAVEAYRRSLLLDPDRDDVRWNLELALDRLEQLRDTQRPLSGSGQQPDERPQPGSGEEPRPEAGAGAEPLPLPGETERREGAADEVGEPPFPLELADQILRAVEERERRLQREKLRRQPRRTRGPDW